MLEVINGLKLDVQVIPPEAPWHLSVLGIVQQLVKRSAPVYAMDEKKDEYMHRVFEHGLHSSQSCTQAWKIRPVSVVVRT